MWRSIEVKTLGFCSLQQILDSPKIPKKLPSKFFLDIQAHLPWSHITTGSISSIKISNRKLIVVKTNILGGSTVDFFSYISYWSSDGLIEAIFKVSSRCSNSRFSVTKVWYPPSWLLPNFLNLWESICKSNDWFFSSHQDNESPKIPELTKTFDLSRHAKSSQTVTTGFMSSTKIAIEKYPPLWTLVVTTILSFPRNWFLIVQKGRELFFNMEYYRFPKLGFPKAANLWSSYKIST